MIVNHLAGPILKKEHALEVQTDLHALLEHGKNRLSTGRTTVRFMGLNGYDLEKEFWLFLISSYGSWDTDNVAASAQ
jgi:hypothetical protein